MHTDSLGEDLELTWRVHRAGYRVTFSPRALVFAESPSTLHDLWRQRVRWARGLLQTVALHRQMIGNPRYGTFGLYLLYNTVTQVDRPVPVAPRPGLARGPRGGGRHLVAARHLARVGARDRAARVAALLLLALVLDRALSGPASPVDRAVVAAVLHVDELRHARRRPARARQSGEPMEQGETQRFGDGPRPRHRWPWLVIVAVVLLATVAAALAVARPWEDVPPTMRGGASRRARSLSIDFGIVTDPDTDWGAVDDGSTGSTPRWSIWAPAGWSSPRSTGRRIPTPPPNPAPTTSRAPRAPCRRPADGRQRDFGLIVDAYVPNMIAADPSIAGAEESGYRSDVPGLGVPARPAVRSATASSTTSRRSASATSRPRSRSPSSSSTTPPGPRTSSCSAR